MSEHLHLAASVEDLSVDTDIEGTSFMCGRAAEFEDAHSEVAAKYVAGVIVFSLVWSAYEWTVEIVSRPLGLKQPKGVRGREILVRVFGDKHFPFLRRAVLQALELSCATKLSVCSREMRRLVRAGFFAGIGAEHLREFRTALAHGDLRKPTPQDWGEKSTYVANDDPVIRQFQTNIRLTLLLIQILARSALDETDTLSAWLQEAQPATLVLTQLHCVPPAWLEYTDGLPLIGAPLLVEER